MSLVKRYPLTAFFVLACALSWWPWILYAFDLLPNPIVGVGRSWQRWSYWQLQKARAV
jgi:hypothetical protein